MSGIIPVENKLNEGIAIVGMSCRFPGSNDVDEFWSLLLNKGDGIVKVPKDRWLAEQCPTVDPGAMDVQAGFLKCPVDEFDAKFFKMNTMELSFTDPQQRLLLEISWEALEDASINPLSLKDSHTGIFTGTWTRDYNVMLNENDSTYNEFFRSYMGNSFGAAAGRMAYFYGTVGSNIATESGCSSSMVAVGLACKSLRRGETNIALACGVNLLLKPFTYKNMEAFISPDGHCKTFDAKADGFGRAEGVGVLVLKRISEAIRDGDRIHAVIRGYGEAQEGPSKSLGTPTVDVEALAMRIALEDAKVEPNEVQFVEAHGTGTAVGDPMEMEAIAQVYSKDRKKPLYVGSVKTNVGHTESCSGITGIIKTVLALKNETIPPHRTLEELNPKIDLQKTPAIIPKEPIPWKRTKGIKRLAGVSSFGITGTDTHLILEEAPIPNQIWSKDKAKFPLNILAISAKSEDGLKDLIKAYANHLKLNRIELKDVAFTANTGRAHFNGFRAAIIGKDCSDVVKKIAKESFVKSVSGSKPKLCFLFSGQGSQYHKMGKTLYEFVPEFRKQFDLCDEILKESHGIQIRDVLWGEKESDLLHRTLYSQTSIFCIEYCLTKCLEFWGIFPDTVVGHSLGEFAAACAAGILSLNDALTLVAERSKLIDSLPSGNMIVVKTDLNKTNNLLKQLSSQKENFMLDFAAINSPDQTTLAGSESCVKEFKKICESKGVKSQILDATHAFHSRQMDPILQSYRKIAESINYSKPDCGFVSGMEGIKLDSSNMDANYWVRHTRESVNFLSASKSVCSEGCTMFIEVGPQAVLSAFILTNLEKENVKCFPLLRKNQEEWETLLNVLASLYTQGFNIDWKRFYKYTQIKKVSLPFYRFQRKKHWFEISKIGNSLNKYNGKELHPLIGIAIPNATSNRIFHINLDVNKESYLMDHVLGKYLIFPGAGFIEMVLASAHASSFTGFQDFNLPYRPIRLDNIKIELPLWIKDDEITELQTVINPEDESNIDGDLSWKNKVTIYRHHGENFGAKKWVRHVSATFSFNFLDSKIKESLDFGSLKKEFKEEIDLSEFYNQLAKVGFNFGPSFRNLKKVWKHDDGQYIAKINVPVQKIDDNINNSYLVHPVVIDAMLQAILLGIDTYTIKSLYIPIFIRRFVWFGKSYGIQNINYIHVHQDLTDDSIGEVTSTLYAEEGEKLAFMQGVTLFETTLENITNSLESQKMLLPRMFEEKWIAESKYETLRTFEDELMNSKNVKEILKECVETQTAIEEAELSDQKQIDEMVLLYVMKAFQELGWNPNIGEKVQLDVWIKNLRIIPQNTMLSRRFFEMLCQDGFCSQTGEMEFIILKRFPCLSDILNRIQFLSSSVKKMKIEMEALVSCLDQLTRVLHGTDDVLSILFGNGERSCLAERLYKDMKVLLRLYELFVQCIEHVLLKWMKNQIFGKKQQHLNILEVGAGTGSATINLLPLFKKHNINYTYTFTDLSPMFFVRAESTFSAYNEHMLYKVLDIENDPKSQGFSPAQYDIIIGVNVLHATKYLTKTLQNVRNLLKPCGLVFILEHFEPQRMIDGVFGLVKGYWRFEDFNQRPYHALVNENKWMELLIKSGFESSTVLKVADNNAGIVLGQASNQIEEYKGGSEDEIDQIWLLFTPDNDCDISTSLESQLKTSGRNVIKILTLEYFKKTSIGIPEGDAQNQIKENIKKVIELAKLNGNTEGFIYVWGNRNAKEIKVLTQGYLNLIQSILSTRFKQNRIPKLFVFTEGVVNVGDQDLGSPLAGTLWGMSRSLRSEHPTMIVRCVDIDPSKESSIEIKVRQAFSELWKDDQDFMIAYRSDHRHVCRLIDLKMQPNPLTLPNSGRFSLILPSSKAISDLKFGPMGRKEVLGNLIEVRVKAAALNFKDLLNVLKPDSQFDKENAVGIDFAGIVTSIGKNVTKIKIGDAVIGFGFENQSLPTHHTIEEDKVIPLPSEMTFAEGSTLPTVFCTVYHCLIDIAKLQKEETILIHAASGGVGLVAIQVAKDIGANIIATAGNKKKRAYLRSLGLKNIFNSRDTSFAKEIKFVTEGKGVQMVLNSLTSPGFKEASLQVCSKEARFVEMSKLNIWTVQELKSMRPDVKYTIVDLTLISPETHKYLMFKLDKYLTERRIQPIKYIQFDCVEIRNALSYLQNANHIGKIVCIMPEIEIINGHWESKHELFNEKSTYLITGGLGGIGLEVSKWMAKKGAKHIVLCGRNKPSQKALKVIELLNNSDKNVIFIQTDVGDFEQCTRLLNDIKIRLPPLRGIMHAAGILSDAVLENQTWDKFDQNFNGKVNGAWNLHELTKDGSYRLEHFVMYSSVASIVGPIGQSNHAASCAFLDCLTQYRNNIGLPAVSINWGQWGQIGVAAEFEVPSLIPFTTRQAFETLELVFKSHKSQVSVLDCDFAKTKSIYSWIQRGYAKDVSTGSLRGSTEFKTKEISKRYSWEDIDSVPTRKEKEEIISNAIKEILKTILKLELNEEIDLNQSFQDLGLDSLLMIELKNILQRLLGSKTTITTSDVSEYNTIHLLTQKLSDLIFKELDENQASLKKKLLSHILQESILPDNIHTYSAVGLPKMEEITNIMMIQTKGIFASYLLESLCSRPQIKTVYCLLPIKNAEKEKQEFLNMLKARDILQGLDINKVKLIFGNLIEPQLGLDSQLYNLLANECDALVCTSLEKEKDYNKLDAIKRDGDEMKNILEFVTSYKTKWFFHASSIFPSIKAEFIQNPNQEEDNFLSESWPKRDDIQKYIMMGYSGSKFVLDRLFAQAEERGIPCKIFRMPYLAGDSRTSYFELNEKHVFYQFLSYMLIGIMPKVPMPFALLPVDFCAKVALNIFLDYPFSPLGIYNLTNPHRCTFKDYFESQELFNAVEINGEENSIIHTIKHLYGDPINYKDNSNYKNFANNSEREICSQKVYQVLPNFMEMVELPIVILNRDMIFAHKTGVLKKFGV